MQQFAAASMTYGSLAMQVMLQATSKVLHMDVNNQGCKSAVYTDDHHIKAPAVHLPQTRMMKTYPPDQRPDLAELHTLQGARPWERHAHQRR